VSIHPDETVVCYVEMEALPLIVERDDVRGGPALGGSGV
jgi:hypothetical protein